MDTDTLFPALAEMELEDCIRPEMKAEREQLRSKHCTDCFTADALRNSSTDCAVTCTKNMTSESLIFSKRILVFANVVFL